jgi:hypothetical protein
LLDGLLDGAVKGLEVVGVRDVLNEPAVGFEPECHVFAERQRGFAFDGDFVVVVKP